MALQPIGKRIIGRLRVRVRVRANPIGRLAQGQTKRPACLWSFIYSRVFISFFFPHFFFFFFWVSVQWQFQEIDSLNCDTPISCGVLHLAETACEVWMVWLPLLHRLNTDIAYGGMQDDVAKKKTYSTFSQADADESAECDEPASQ